jgi:hypothetical protein
MLYSISDLTFPGPTHSQLPSSGFEKDNEGFSSAILPSDLIVKAKLLHDVVSRLLVRRWRIIGRINPNTLEVQRLEGNTASSHR